MSLVPDPVSGAGAIVKGIAVIVVTLCLGLLVWRVVSLSGQVQEQKAEISDYKTANENLTTQVGQCNAAVEGLKNEAKARAEAAKTALQAAIKQSAAFTATSTALMNQTPSGDDCRAATGLLKSYFSGKP